MRCIGDKIMCKKLREISGLSSEQILLLGEELSPPVNIENILDKLGIKYDAMDFSDIESKVPDIIKNRGEILGAVTLIDDDVFIYYSKKNKSKNRTRFTLAHELAHCCLNAGSLENKGHIEFRFDEKSDDMNEKAANIFAGQLLIPKEPLLEKYNNMIVPVSDVLANEFNVSTNVMEARLSYLGLPFYSLVTKLDKGTQNV